MRIRTWNIEAMTGYKPKTTFYEDFSIADAFGVGAIRDTYKRAMGSWSSDCEYLTELVMALNWKIFEHHGRNDALARLYDELWRTADEYAVEHLKGDELTYYFRTTD